MTKRKSQSNTGLSFDSYFEPMTRNQQVAQELWYQGKHLNMLGTAGSGKTYVALSLALEEVLGKDPQYKKVMILRSSVAVREIGFQPGNAKEKAKVYESPYVSIVNSIFERGDAYDILIQKNKIEFMLTSFLRGATFDDCILIVDECQNMSFAELNTIITRVGTNSRIIFCGDTKQDDLTSERFKETSGLRKFYSIVNQLEEFGNVVYTVDDIVRSDLVRSYIIAKEEYETAEAA